MKRVIPLSFSNTALPFLLLDDILFPLSRFSPTASVKKTRVSRDTPAHPRPVDQSRPPRFAETLLVLFFFLYSSAEEKGGNSFHEQESKRFIRLCSLLSLPLSPFLPMPAFPRHFGTTAHSSLASAHSNNRRRAQTSGAINIV